jgi:hypothetical protein
MLVPEKISILVSTGQRFFKQMRTNDLMAYFQFTVLLRGMAGRFYRNILFEDRFGAKRALESLQRTPDAFRRRM